VLAGAVAAADGPLATVTQRFVGLNDVVSGAYSPPDVQVAAGPGYVVELVNLAERVWRTTPGASVQEVRTTELGAFFGKVSDRLTDPRILYDAPSGRWLASISDVDASSVLLAVSTSSDPTGAWTVSSFPATGCADQPRLGLADGIVVLAADAFASCKADGATLGSELWVVNKQELIDGSTAPAYTTYGPDAAYASFAPVQSLSPTSTEYVVSVDEPTSRVAHLLTVDGVPPAPVRVQEVATPPIDRLSRPAFAAQPPDGAGRAQMLIETNDDRVLDSVWENGRLWFSADTGCVPAGDVLPRTCGRLVELSTVAGTVDWDTDLFRAGAHVFFPAIRPDGSGNIVVVYAESGAKVPLTLAAIGRTPDGTFTQPVVIAQTAGPFLGDRYGDYFGAARDPIDPSVVWVAGEAGTDVIGGRGWTTALASVAVTGAGAAPPATVVAPPPGVRALPAAPRSGGRVRLAYRALDDGTSIRSIVTVGRRQSVVFRTTTAPATLHADQFYYVYWRPAARLRGAFTFCVRSISAGGAQSPQSCAAITLR
jgi:hypothetical protein